MHSDLRLCEKILVRTAAIVAFALFTLPALGQDLGSAPGWAQSMAPGTWAAISHNKIEDVDPANDPAANPNYPNTPTWNGNNGPSCIIECWNGGALATGLGAKGSLIIWGGGHNGYFGNEVYAFDLDTQAWSRLSNPYPNIVFPVTDGIWPDGSPSVPHTYGFAGYHPATNSFTVVQTELNNLGGYVAPVPVFFDLTTKRWRRGPRNSQHLQYGGWSVYDASRDAWWAEGGDSGGAFVMYSMNGNGTTGSWTNYPAKFSALDAMAQRDPVNDIIVLTRFGSGGTTMHGIDLKNPAGAPVTLTQGGAPPSREGRHGWEWSARRGAFIYWRRGGDVYQVKLSGNDWRTGTWTWTKITSTTNSVVPQDPSPGIYNRFRLAGYGSTEVAVVVNSTSGAVYAFRLPETVGPQAPILRPIP